MEALHMKGKHVYYWEFQGNGLTAQVASSDLGTVRVSVGFTRREHLVSELRKAAPDARLLEDAGPNEVLIRTPEACVRGENPSIRIPWDIDATVFRH